MADTLFTNVTVLDGTGAAPFAGEVLVSGNRIRAIARDGARLPREGAALVDGGGATLMPGLIEAHLHLSFLDITDLAEMGEVPVEEHVLGTMKNARLVLDHGFTAGCSAAAAKPRLDVVIRNAIEAGDIPGPRLLAASPEFTVTGGLGDVNLLHMKRDSVTIVCDGPDEFRKAARLMAREGVDILKIDPSGERFMPYARSGHTVMNEAEIAAVCEVALARGKRVASHARSAESVKLSLKHGCDIIYHATLADDEALDALEAAKDRIFVAPALGVTYGALYEGAAATLDARTAAELGGRREFETGVENMKKLRARGVRVLPGGDYGFSWNRMGRNARDLELFVKLLGCTPMEAIVAATKMGGELMGLPGELGIVREGSLADLLLVDGDPLADVAILQDADRLTAIMKDGSFHKPPAARPARARAAAE